MRSIIELSYGRNRAWASRRSASTFKDRYFSARATNRQRRVISLNIGSRNSSSYNNQKISKSFK